MLASVVDLPVVSFVSLYFPVSILHPLVDILHLPTSILSILVSILSILVSVRHILLSVHHVLVSRCLCFMASPYTDPQ